MSNQIIVPSLGESVTEATVSKWLKHVGEEVDSAGFAVCPHKLEPRVQIQYVVDFMQHGRVTTY